MQNVFWTERCTGCRNCEIACSYHHMKIFSPEISSIDVQKREEGKFVIVLYTQAKDRHMACDCKSDDEFCLKYCPVVAKGELGDIMKRKRITWAGRGEAER